MPGINPGDVLPQASDWEKFKVIIVNEFVKLTEFEINYSADVEHNFGKGGEAVSWSVKQFKRDAKCTVDMLDLQPLINAAVAFGGDITKLPPMPITAEAAIGAFTYKLQIPAAKITKFPMKFKIGDAGVPVQLDIAILSYPIITMT